MTRRPARPRAARHGDAAGCSSGREHGGCSGRRFEAATVTIRRTLQAGAVKRGRAKTTGSLRTVRLQDRAIDALRELPTLLRQDQPVFTDKQWRPVDPTSFRRNVFAKAVKDAGLEGRSPKDMRHTFATLALASRAPLEWVSRQLGHSDIKTTLDYYLRWLPAMDDHGLDVLNAAAAGADSSQIRHPEADDAAI